MNRFFVGVLAVLTIVVSAMWLQIATSEEQHPPHKARPDLAGVQIGSLPLSATGGDLPDVAGITTWIEGVERHESEEAARLEAARSVAERRVAPQGTGPSGDCAALAAELGLSTDILWRESRCSTDAYNASGCSGRGCLGAAQLDAGHFAPVSPWNSAASGACADLNPSIPSEYAECVSRLPASAWAG